MKHVKFMSSLVIAVSLSSSAYSDSHGIKSHGMIAQNNQSAPAQQWQQPSQPDVSALMNFYNSGNQNQQPRQKQTKCQTRPIPDMYGEIIRYDTVCE